MNKSNAMTDASVATSFLRTAADALAGLACLSPDTCGPLGLDGVLNAAASDGDEAGLLQLDPEETVARLCACCRARYFVALARSDVRALRCTARGEAWRVVIYARQATGHVFGNHDQVNACQRYAKEWSLCVIDTVTDSGPIDRAPAERPEFLRALDMARRNAAVVLVADFDRVCSNTAALAAFFLARPEALVLSATENIRSDNEVQRRAWGAFIPASPRRAAPRARAARKGAK
jgi:Resolvase, N terminal domain